MGRRVTTDPVPGADPAPQSLAGRAGPAARAAEDRPGAWGREEQPESNAERLLAEQPPHHG